jgi:hypothetical protein
MNDDGDCGFRLPGHLLDARMALLHLCLVDIFESFRIGWDDFIRPVINLRGMCYNDDAGPVRKALAAIDDVQFDSRSPCRCGSEPSADSECGTGIGLSICRSITGAHE